MRDDDLDDAVVDRLRFGQVLAGRTNRQAQVGPVEPSDHHGRPLHPQCSRNVDLHRGSRGGSQRQLSRRSERRNSFGNAQVLRPEIVSPLTDQMGLVHDEQAYPGGTVDQASVRLRVVQLLGAQQEEVELTRVQRGQRGAPILPMQAGVEHRRADRRVTGAAALGEGPHLVTLQGDQWRYDDGEPAEYQSGHLVDRALAAPRWKDGQRVATGHQRSQRAPLRGTQPDTEHGRRYAIRISHRTRVGHC